jgi:hypothetical protein
LSEEEKYYFSEIIQKLIDVLHQELSQNDGEFRRLKSHEERDHSYRGFKPDHNPRDFESDHNNLEKNSPKNDDEKNLLNE